jgi:hypothetical protein
MLAIDQTLSHLYALAQSGEVVTDNDTFRKA